MGLLKELELKREVSRLNQELNVKRLELEEMRRQRAPWRRHQVGSNNIDLNRQLDAARGRAAEALAERDKAIEERREYQRKLNSSDHCYDEMKRQRDNLQKELDRICGGTPFDIKKILAELQQLDAAKEWLKKRNEDWPHRDSLRGLSEILCPPKSTSVFVSVDGKIYPARSWTIDHGYNRDGSTVVTGLSKITVEADITKYS